MEYKTENGTVIGNVGAKYESRNPIMRLLMHGFFSTLDEMISHTGLSNVHEVGCGEGHLSARLAGMGMEVRSSDFSNQIIAQASALNPSPRIRYSVRSIYDLDPDTDGAPLVVCCEVLEHLEDPERGLRQLAKITGEYCILSVPREPIFRAMQMARGKYLRDLGNVPGHIQHWGKSSFMKLVSRQFDILEARSPLPWTMLLCRPRVA